VLEGLLGGADFAEFLFHALGCIGRTSLTVDREQCSAT
jgi:hypothetical protein